MAFDTISPCAADALRSIRQVKINGIMTGFSYLDECIAAVQEEHLASESAIRTSLMARIRISNYIPPGAGELYAAALMEEYHKTVRIHEEESGTE